MANQIYYRIVKAELVQFATLTNSFDPKKEYVLNNEIGFTYNPADSVLSCTLSVMMADETTVPMMKATMLCGFEIKKESLEEITHYGEVKFSTNVVSHIASLTYSSMRGAISIKVDDTPLRGFVLPLANISAHIKSEIVFKLTE